MIRLLLILLICVIYTARASQETSLYTYETFQADISASEVSEYNESKFQASQETTELGPNSSASTTFDSQSSL